MLLEVIATTLRDAVEASAAGVDRIELITSFLEGGLTPSIGLVEEVVQAVDIPVQVMVRPHSHSFCYDNFDVRTMVNNIRRIRAIGAHGVVIGCLTLDKNIDMETLKRLMNEADGMSITFHRAFDETRNLDAALQQLMQFRQIDRVLTSGGQKSVLESVDVIRHLVGLTRGSHLKVMPGSGLSIGRLREFLQRTGDGAHGNLSGEETHGRVREVHFGKGVRMDSDVSRGIDGDRIRQVKSILEAFAD